MPKNNEVKVLWHWSTLVRTCCGKGFVFTSVIIRIKNIKRTIAQQITATRKSCTAPSQIQQKIKSKLGFYDKRLGFVVICSTGREAIRVSRRKRLVQNLISSSLKNATHTHIKGS